jgi:predicted PurR-regulated permease PerM
MGLSGNKTGMDILTRRAVTIVTAGAIGVITLVILWNALGILSLFFTSILLAVFFRSLSEVVARTTRLPVRFSLVLVLLGLAGLLTLGIWRFSVPLGEQIEQLAETLPVSIALLEEELGQYEWGEVLFEEWLSLDDLLGDRFLLIGQVAGIFSTTLGALASFLVVIVLAIYLAFDPKTYVEGLLRLVPIPRRARIRQVFVAVKQTLQWWLLSRAVAMVAVGVMVSLGLWALGIPMASALGMVAAILDFIPNIGPLLGTLPAVLIALIQGPTTALAVVILYFVIQQIESYVITPVLQQQMVKVPPALTITAQILLTLVLGAIGLLIASPLMAVLIVVVRMLYVEDVLGDKPDQPIAPGTSDPVGSEFTQPANADEIGEESNQ